MKVPIRRALISVYDKTGLAELAQALSAHGVEIVSTGSTAAAINAAGVAVTKVEDVTGFPECLDGRVKTLHPGIHAGLLADLRQPAHAGQLAELGIEPFQLLVSSLYPFEQTVASGAAPDECVEQIDIGGPAMVRAAAKNHASVAVVTDPGSYGDVVEALAAGGFTLEQRRRLAARAYARTAAYDAAVASWFASSYAPDPTASDTGWPDVIAAVWSRREVLRYGENPHQGAALYAPAGSGGAQAAASAAGAARAASAAGNAGAGAAKAGAGGSTGAAGAATAAGNARVGAGTAGGAGAAGAGLTAATQLHGKAMSYNNYVDAAAALRAAYDFTEPAVAIIKHSNPCGIAVGAGIAEAHRKAHACDPVSAFGGVIAANGEVTEEMAEQLAEIFTEVIVAPSFSARALDLLTAKKNLRLLTCPPPVTAAVRRKAGSGAGPVEWRQVDGALLTQSADLIDAPGDGVAGWELRAGPPASPDLLADLVFAWRACRAVKSNAIVLAAAGATVGVGMGQVNRVDAARLAVARAGDRAGGSAAASDAYFPFPDALETLIEAGVRAVVQPGGSIRDELSLAAAQKAGITMYFTGVRHFFH